MFKNVLLNIHVHKNITVEIYRMPLWVMHLRFWHEENCV